MSKRTDDERIAFSARLNRALDAIGFPEKQKGRQSELAKVMSVSQKGARKWLEGEAFPSKANLIRLAHIANTSVEHLLMGAPPPDAAHPIGPPPTDEAHQNGQWVFLSCDERSLLDAYRLLEPLHRDKLIEPLLTEAQHIRHYIERAKKKGSDPPDDPPPVMKHLVQAICTGNRPSDDLHTPDG